MTDEYIMQAKYPGKFTECGYKINVGDAIIYNAFRKTAKHKVCPEPDYIGTEQTNIFNMWIQRAEEINMKEGKNE